MKGSDMAAHRGLKRWLFCEQNSVVCGYSIVCSYVSSFCDCCVTIW